MVRLTLLLAVLAACLAAAPAQADTLSLSAPVEGAVAQATATATSVADTAGATTAAVSSSVRPVVTGARGSVVSVGRATPATEATAQTAASVAESAAYTTAAAGSGPAASAPAASAPDPAAGELKAGAASSDRTVRVRAGGAREGSRPAASLRAGAEPRRAVTPVDAAPKVVDAPRATAAAPHGVRPGESDTGPSTNGGGTASPAPASFYFGGLALLALSSLCLAGPRLCRRLLIQPATLRPVAFVALLERPG
jgi:hypothetical protein